MTRASPASGVLTIRVSRALERRIAAEARRRRQTRSETARELLEAALQGPAVPDPADEARRQSRLASERQSESEMLDFISDAADLNGWK